MKKLLNRDKKEDSSVSGGSAEFDKSTMSETDLKWYAASTLSDSYLPTDDTEDTDSLVDTYANSEGLAARNEKMKSLYVRDTGGAAASGMEESSESGGMPKRKLIMMGICCAIIVGIGMIACSVYFAMYTGEKRSMNDPYWTQWTAWGICLGKCGRNGTKYKQRYYSTANGTKYQTRNSSCTAPKCESGWDSWEKWEKCPVTCGGGKQRRSRECNHHGDCVGRATEEEICGNSTCPVFGKPQWSSWTDCKLNSSRRCDSTRRWTCDPADTSTSCRNATQHYECTAAYCPPSWGTWSAWSTCCHLTRRRTRKCVDGICGEKDTEAGEESCPKDECAAEWTLWTSWTSCGKTCGDENVTSSRTCIYGACDEADTSRQKSCRLAECPPVWTAWTAWTTCTKTCGSGEQRKTRKCLSDNCLTRNDTKSRECNTELCPPVYTKWSTWSECDQSCGNGQRTASRTCTGGDCARGYTRKNETCNTNPCPVIWTNWSEWSNCSKDCGGGIRYKTRTCSTHNCPAEQLSNKTQDCNEDACTYTPWSKWSECSKTCNNGTIQRSRSCRPGVPCIESIDGTGDTSQTKHCYLTPCKGEVTEVADKWTTWTSWSKCDNTCGFGYRHRSKKCMLNVCKVGSKVKMREPCKMTTCPGYFSPWGPWSKCNKKCMQLRKQTCISKQCGKTNFFLKKYRMCSDCEKG